MESLIILGSEMILMSRYYPIHFYARILYLSSTLNQIKALIDKICTLERQLNPSVSDALLQEIRTASETSTHM